jgi:hypothetical protein
MFTRTNSGWLTQPLAPPADSFETDSYWSVNANAGTALFSAPAYPGGPDDFYDRQPNGTFTAVGPFGEPKAGNGVIQAGSAQIQPDGVFATADLTHIVYATEKSLWSFDHSEHVSLYQYAGVGNSAPEMVGVEGGLGSHDLISECRTLLGGEESPTRAEALSEDGNIVYFSALGHSTESCPEAAVAPSVTGLYARIDGESGDAHTVLISGRATKGCTTGECVENTTHEEDFREPNFEGASSDGSQVFFTDTQQLTDGASESSGRAANGCNENSEPGGCNLYESVCAEPCGTPAEAPNPKARELIDISEGAKEAGGPRVQGVVAVSADGTHVYFVARGVLTGGQEDEAGEKAEDEQDNLYVYADGHLTFIAQLSPSDEQEKQWGFQDNLIANVTPDGEFLVFTDSRALTGDDTRVEGEAAAQVFEYDAATGQLKRISVGESGFDDNGNAGTGNAYIVPARRGGASDGSVPVDRAPSMSENGELVFFESPIALVPGALGDVPIAGGKFAENVYEYYRGQVYLISDGADTTPPSYVPESESESPTELLGVGVSGGDVLFSSFDQLVPEDTDSLRDYYDAHVCSALEPCIERSGESASCGEGSCQGGGSPAPGVGTPASVTLSSVGNLLPPVPVVVKPLTRAQKLAKALKVCKTKRSKKKRVACEGRARKSYGPVKKAKKAKVAAGRGLVAGGLGVGYGKRG